MSLFDSIDEALLPTILKFVDQPTLPLLPLVSKAFRRQCRYVEVEWDFTDYPDVVQERMSEDCEKLPFTFFAFKTTKILLRAYGVYASSHIVNIVRRFPQLRHLDLRRCYNVRSLEWNTFFGTLEHRRDGFLVHLKKLDTPHFRVDGLTFDDVEWMKAFTPEEEEEELTDYDSDEDDSRDFSDWNLSEW